MLFRNLISRAVREFASDPENQEKAKKIYADEVAPRARQLTQQRNRKAQRVDRIPHSN